MDTTLEHMDETMDASSHDRVGVLVDSLDRVHDPARIAIYDDLLSSPRIIDIEPDDTKEFIYSLATEIYNQARDAGGSIPYTIITQVVENYIHARFNEMVISIFDNGNTIRFTDQGPGIKDKNKAQQPGYSSATKEMKQYINGVGSGLPIVKEYLETKQGRIYLEDNMDNGAVVTITLNDDSDLIDKASQVIGSISDNKSIDNVLAGQDIPVQSFRQSEEASGDDNEGNREYAKLFVNRLPKRAPDILPLFNTQDIWGVKDLSDISGIPLSSTHALLQKLEENGIVKKFGKKWELTDIGKEVSKELR